MESPVPDVSVIVPFYNPGSFLSDAINSVLSQTFTRWELILVDDGSTDSSPLIARYFSLKHPNKIFYYQHKDCANHGMAATRLLGISYARGQYIANLDSDDFFEPTKLAYQVKILQENPDVSMIFSPMLLWSSWNGGHDQLQTFDFSTPKLIKPPNYIKYLLNRKNDPHGYLVRAHLLRSKYAYETVPTICEDWTFYSKLFMSESVYIGERPLYFYRIHPSQSCNRLTIAGKFYLSFLPFYHWFFRYLLSLPRISSSIWITVIREYLVVLLLSIKEKTRDLLVKLV